MARTFGGIHAVLYALFDAEGQLSWPLMAEQIELCIGAGVDGIVVLGLATEVGKLTFEERQAMVAHAAGCIAGRVPLGVTITGDALPQQQEILRVAESQGADWVILQAPAGSYGADQVIDFFGKVAAMTTLPVAIQNAPQLMGRGLSAADIGRLVAAYPNITHIKGEMPVLEVERVVREAGSKLVVLNGQGGLEMIDNLQAGCSGFILAPDVVDWAVRVYRAWTTGDAAGARRYYGTMVQESVFVMRSLEHLHTYGKRIFGLRAGIDIHDRSPAMPPTAFGMTLAMRHSSELSGFGSLKP